MTRKELKQEAEEYAIGLTYPKFQDNQIANMVLRNVKGAFQKGAEFGYNKANEWHYVKDGDLPKEDDVYLVYTTRGVLLGHYEQGGADGETDFIGEPYSDFTEYPSEMLFIEDEIIAWKEIVLPELKESE
jgi:hypothetical protein